MRGIKKWDLILILMVLCLTIFLLPLMFLSPKPITFSLPKEQIPREDNDVASLDIFTNLGITSSIKPYRNHLWIEINSTTSYLTDSANTEEIYKTIDKGANWTQPNGDFTRPHIVTCFWFDRGNDLLYGGDAANVFVIDLTDDSVTELGLPNVVPIGYTAGNPYDLFIISGDLYCSMSCENAPANTGLAIYKWVDPNWVYQDDIADGGSIIVTFSYATVVGTNAYFIKYDFTGKWIHVFKFNSTVPSLTNLESLNNSDVPGVLNQLFTAYDGSDLLYFVAKATGDGKTYLRAYSIGDDTLTTLGEYNIVLMLDRNTAPGVMEKAFHVTEYDVYELQSTAYQLHLIVEVDSDAALIGITDHLLMNDNKDVFEWTDVLSYSTQMEINYNNMDAPSATLTVDKIGYPVVKGTLMTIRDKFLTAIPPILYRGTYNFRDDLVGSVPSGWIDNSGGNTSARVISDYDNHKKVLRIVDNDGADFADIEISVAQLANQTNEFWFTKNSVAANTNIVYYLYEGATIIVQLRFATDDLAYHNGTAYQALKNNFLVAGSLTHFRIVMDETANTFDMYINGVLEGAGLDYKNNSTIGINKIRIVSDIADTGYNGYFDAIGLGADPAYTIGDNLRVEAEETIIFEGFVDEFSDRRMQAVLLTSPAEKDLNSKFPSSDDVTEPFSGRTDEIIVALIATYADYITIGTLSAGTAMGTITFGGEKSLKEILDEFSLIDGFIWYLTPTGVLYYNDGTVDSLENFTAASSIFNVDRAFGQRAVNRVDVKGGFVDGVQVEGTVAEDVEAQQLVGITPYEDVHSHLNTNALCTTVNTAILARYGVQPLIVPFSHRDATVGLILPGETVTFEYDLVDPNVASDQFGIRGVIYDVLLGVGRYKISDVLI